MDAVARAEPGAAVSEIAAGQRAVELFGAVEAVGCQLEPAAGSRLSNPMDGRLWCMFRKVTRPDEPIRSCRLDGPASGLSGAGAGELGAADYRKVRQQARQRAVGMMDVGGNS